MDAIVNHGLWVIKTCQYRFANSNIQVGDINDMEGHAYAGHKIYEEISVPSF